MSTAKDIMSKPAISVTEDHTLREVLELLVEHRFSGMPVVNAEGKVVGIISDTDIIRYSQQLNVVPLSNLSGWISPYAEISDLASLKTGFELLHKTKVSEVMTKKVYSVRKDTPNSEVAQLMSRRNINRVPIIDSSDKLVGIVTRTDLVKCMASE
ncbi:MAG: CBS domain-containing protein [Bacillota bacterium]|nr:CBS domain-containing protein [Bacillota bacterium]